VTHFDAPRTVVLRISLAESPTRLCHVAGGLPS
jgi:hypothetical protein